MCDGYKIVWESYGWKGYKKVWEYVLGKVNKIDKGWVLVESGSYTGDGSVYGMSKEYRNLGWIQLKFLYNNKKVNFKYNNSMLNKLIEVVKWIYWVDLYE